MQENIITAQAQEQPTAQKRAFSTVEMLFSWVCLLVGYLFCRVHPVGDNSLGGFLYVITLFSVTAVILHFNSFKIKGLSLAVMLSALLVNFALLLSANTFLCTLAYIYCAVSYCYFVYSACGNYIERGFKNTLIMDYFKSLIILPFCSFEYIFKALFSGKAAKGGKLILKVAAGIAVAIIPSIIIYALLSYDDSFIALFSDFLDFGSMILGIPIAMYIYGLYISAADRRCENVINAEQCSTAAKKIGIVPAVTCACAVLPILFIYVVFFISQFGYYVSGFTGVLPENFSYANYAREGFFQLCAVSVINLLIIFALSLFMRKSITSGKIMYKIISLVFAVFTLILISTAIAKMVMYIDCYGLTQKRVYSTWFMIVLALIFILLALRQFIPRLNIVALSMAVFVIMLGILSLSNADRIIARYNVERYMDKTLKTVDIAAMRELGDCAVPELVRLENYLLDKNCNAAEWELYAVVSTELDRIEGCSEENAVFSFNLPRYAARKALETRGK